MSRIVTESPPGMQAFVKQSPKQQPKGARFGLMFYGLLDLDLQCIACPDSQKISSKVLWSLF